MKCPAFASRSNGVAVSAVWVLLALADPANAQTPAKPPIAQAWIDVATFSGMSMSMPMGGGMGAGGTVFRR